MNLHEYDNLSQTPYLWYGKNELDESYVHEWYLGSSWDHARQVRFELRYIFFTSPLAVICREIVRVLDGWLIKIGY